MKQLGNLAIVCAQRPDVTFQLLRGQVQIHIRVGSDTESQIVAWDDDEKIGKIIRELNFGKYAAKNKC